MRSLRDMQHLPIRLGQATQSHPRATTRPVDRHRIGTPRPPQGHPKATPRLPQGYPKAPPRLHQGSTKAPPKLPQGSSKARRLGGGPLCRRSASLVLRRVPTSANRATGLRGVVFREVVSPAREGSTRPTRVAFRGGVVFRKLMGLRRAGTERRPGAWRPEWRHVSLMPFRLIHWRGGLGALRLRRSIVL